MNVGCSSISRMILDDIEFPSLRKERLLGGGGIYAIFGMRIVTKNVGYVVKCGPDFNLDILRDLEITLKEIVLPYETPRALNTYKDNHRTFSLLNSNYDKFRTTFSDIPSNWNISHLHGVLSWKRVLQVQIYFKGHIIWEPNPDDWESLEDLQMNWITCISKVLIVSPNHIEAMQFLGLQEPIFDSIESSIKFYANIAKVLSHEKTIVILRCSYMGTILYKNCNYEYIPPYYTSKLLKGIDDPEIVDPTGCGNAFTGAVTAHLSLTGNSFENLVRACHLGSIASGLTIEQFGPPNYKNGLWNETEVQHRYNTYIDKCKSLKEYHPNLFILK
eukprot:NODE_56_length_28873_cov_1.243101.p9 type:complete len:331 gc:universal NODE_56_length_28873_cov_1.243101:11041-12033(+)